MARALQKRGASKNKLPKQRDNLKASSSLNIQHRSNITLARLQDETRGKIEKTCTSKLKGILTRKSSYLNTVELFAGAGGMGLGFMMAKRASKRFRLIFSGEVNPIYTETLKRNHQFFSQMHTHTTSFVPKPECIHPINLSERGSFKHIVSLVNKVGNVDVLIGGPPCQGFSNANRNSWSSNNPNNKLVHIFTEYVDKLRPYIFLMENVQGIVWMSKYKDNNNLSVAEYTLRRMNSLGYLVFPKLLDAVWYGVPQHRTRFFLLGIHKDLGYNIDDFGSWGPFPAPSHGPAARHPFVTIRDAIADLPVIGNGHSMDKMEYREPQKKVNKEYLKIIRKGAPKKIILDHITSKHANYVIERYKHIPAGGNWRDIAEMMSNYAEIERTHSNIYKRLKWDEPSITIGHYRKSMLVHPDQHRGLSLREACRLQSFPDWFRFAGTLDGKAGGLGHKQQQLANAVCPLMSKAIAEFLLDL